MRKLIFISQFYMRKLIFISQFYMRKLIFTVNCAIILPVSRLALLFETYFKRLKSKLKVLSRVHHLYSTI